MQPENPQLLQDRDKRLWVQYSKAERILRPRYNNVSTSNLVWKYITEEFNHEKELSQCCVLLPFHSIPVWPKKRPKKRLDHLAFLWCGNPTCTKMVVNQKDPKQVYQVCLQIVMGYTQREEEHMAWSWTVRLLCADCAPVSKFSTTFFPIVLMIRHQIYNQVIAAYRSFNDRLDRTMCYICENEATTTTTDIPICGSLDCKKVLDQLPDHKSIIHPPPQIRLASLIQHFESKKLDLSTPLQRGICSNNNCSNLSNTEFSCHICKRVAYCSQECKLDSDSIHKRHCASYHSIWKLENVLYWKTDKPNKNE